jgi:hypothetical protein
VLIVKTALTLMYNSFFVKTKVTSGCVWKSFEKRSDVNVILK